MKISKYNERPLFFNANASYIPKEGVAATIFLDIDKNKIIDFSYEQKGLEKWIPSFSILGEKVIGKNLSEARELSFGDEFINLPVKLLNQAIDDFIGKTYRFELLGEKAEALICRCFGVYKGQVLDALKNGSGDLLSILDQTGATGGCSTCLFDVEKIIHDFQGETILVTPKKERVLGMTPVELYLKMDEIIKKWDPKNEVSEIKNSLVVLKINSRQAELKEFVDEKFKGELFFNFLS
ncbi:MAG: hypothetical protein DRQ88_02105 [Epsilonproteobacteria bacterium]|nr:MAG: hypothetical protein DRQ89_00850 [Campylobacterota bacterium]RLA67656.1 MAG: hypothetical protein DRQ88_02105 [Campylobacterota bacterium]